MSNKSKGKWIIKDWAGNILTAHGKFDSFEDAEEALCIFFDKNKLDYEEERQEYYIVQETDKEEN